MKKIKDTLLSIIIIIVILSVTFFGGGRYYINKIEVPQINSDTILVYDTIERTIIDSFPFYVDSLIYVEVEVEIPAIVDTAKILKDYYTEKTFNRVWKDSLVKVNLTDVLYKNNLKSNEFKYTLLRPQQVVTNVTNITNYQSYIYGGLYTNVSSTFTNVYGFQLTYAGPQWSYSVGVAPFQSFYEFSLSYKLIKLKK